MARPYLYGQLRKDLSPEAERHNDAWLGTDTLGIEVTADYLAERCGLGNIDPQHQADGFSSAIEEALSFPLPKAGAKMVTIRPDKDSIGAMAVMRLRSEGREREIDKLLVSWIGSLDRHGYGNAQKIDADLAACFDSNVVTDALNVICLNNEPWPEMADKVYQVGRILCGSVSSEELKNIVALRGVKRPSSFFAEMYGAVAFVRARGKLDEARNWANRRYPVAVIFDEEHLSHGGKMRKWSIVRQPGHFDRRGFEDSINSAEARARGLSVSELKRAGLSWGGTSNIVSSPPGVGRESRLGQETVLTLVMAHF